MSSIRRACLIFVAAVLLSACSQMPDDNDRGLHEDAHNNGDAIATNDEAGSRLRYRDRVFSDVTVRRDVLYATVDGEELFLDIYAPLGDEVRNRPVMIVASGGGFQEQDRGDVDHIAENFARRGYVAATMDYRVLGRPPLDADELAIAGVTALHDLFAAVRFFRASAVDDNRFGVRARAIFVAGVSAGGVMAMMAASFDPSDPVVQPALQKFLNANGGVFGTVGAHRGIAPNVQGAMALSGAVLDIATVDARSAPLYAAHEEFDPVVPCMTAAEGASATGLVVAGACDVVAAQQSAGATAEIFLIEASNGHVAYSEPQLHSILDGAADFFFHKVLARAGG